MLTKINTLTGVIVLRKEPWILSELHSSSLPQSLSSLKSPQSFELSQNTSAGLQNPVLGQARSPVLQPTEGSRETPLNLSANQVLFIFVFPMMLKQWSVTDRFLFLIHIFFFNL